MKNLLFLLLLTLSISASAQDHKFRFGVVFSPNISDNLLSNDGNTEVAVVNVFKKIEDKAFSYYTYLFAQYALSKRWSMRVGAGYSKSGYVIDRRKVTFAQPEPNAPEYVAFAYDHYDINLPVLGRYSLSNKNNTFYFIGGLTPQIKISRIKTLTSWYADGRITKMKEDDHQTDYRKLNINGTVGIGYDLALFQKTRLFLQPTFDCNILGASKMATLNRRIYNIGLNIGLVFG